MTRRSGRSTSLALATTLLLSACSGNVTGAPVAGQGVAVDVQPRNAQVAPGGTVPFAAAVTGTANTAVTWVVVEAVGGTIDGTGHYTAPAATGLYHVRATSQADPSVQGVANVTVTSTPAVGVAISPSSALADPGGTVAFTAIVTGAADTSVTWSVQEASGCGSVTQAGVYTAPGSATTCHVVATSNADPTKSAVAAVTVAGSPGATADCAAAALRSTGTVYYYCDCQAGSDPACVAGNDANAGTSPSAPRRTIGDAANRWSSMASGSTIALCRGGVWTGNFNYLANKNCGTTEAQACDLRDYVPSWGTLATAKPMLDLGSGGMGIAFVNTTQNARLWNLYFKSTTSNHDAGDGMIGIYDSPSRIDICNVTVDGGKVGMNIQTSAAPSYLTVRHSTITNIGQTGIYSIADGAVYDSNLYLNNQQAISPCNSAGACGNWYNHDHYVFGTTSNVVIRNSEFTTTAGHCNNAQQCNGVMVYWTDRQTNPIFENNFLHGIGHASHYAFSSSDNGSATQNTGGIFRRNRIDWSAAGLGTGVEMSCCTNCQVTDNIFIAGGNRALGVPEQTGQCGGGGNSGTIVRNNTFYSSTSGAQMIYQGAEGSNYVFENNAAWLAGAGTCYSISRPLASGHPLGPDQYCRNGTGAALGTVFVDAPNGNFKPAAGSPLVGLGNPTYYSPVAIGTILWDPTDTGVPRTAPVDSGAMVH